MGQSNGFSLETQLRQLWAFALDIKPSDITDQSNFFELGADSVTVIKLINNAPDYGIGINTAAIFSSTNFGELLKTCDLKHEPNSQTAVVNNSTEKLSHLKPWAALQCGVRENDIEHIFPCTPVQRDFTRSHLELGVYFHQGFYRLKGSVGHFCRVWNEIVKRTPSFRTRIICKDDLWYQVVVDQENAWVIHHDLNAFKIADKARQMTLGTPLSRQALIYQDGAVYFGWSSLHSIEDGWARGLLHEDFEKALNNLEAFLATPPRLPFSLYVDHLDQMGADRANSYWANLLSGLERFDYLYPAAFDKPQLALAKMSKLATIPKGVNRSIGQGTLAHAAWSLVLSVVAQTDDIFFPATRTGRACQLKGVDNIMGCTLATVPFRIKIRPGISIIDFLMEVQQQLIEGIAYEPWGRGALWKHFGHNRFLQSNLLPQLEGRDFLFDSVSGTDGDNHVSLTPLEQESGAYELGLLLFSYPKNHHQQQFMAAFDENLIPHDRMSNLIDLYADSMSILSQGGNESATIGELLNGLAHKHSTLSSTNVASTTAKSTIQVQTLSDLVENGPEHPAFVLPHSMYGVSLNSTQFRSLVHQMQKVLSHLGVRKGNVISIAIPNGLEFVICFFAICSMGAIVAPLNPGYLKQEYSFYLEAASSTILLLPRTSFQNKSVAIECARSMNIKVVEIFSNGVKVQSEVLDKTVSNGIANGQPSTMQDLPQPNDVALLLYTSGTTGKPKAVPLTHANLIQGARTVQNTYEMTSDDRGLLIMPLFHIHGIVAGLLAPMLSCSVIAISSSVTPEFWQLVARNRITWFTGTPTMHKMITQLPKPAIRPRLRFVRSCSSPLSPALLAELEVLYEAPVLEAYGMTEAAHQMASNLLTSTKRIAGSVGQPTGVDLCILAEDGSPIPEGEPGEICIRGPNVTGGYLNNPSANSTAFTSGGFFRTGDQGVLMPDGSVRITARIKELINKGGEKISPIEIDNMLSKHPAVSEAVSFAIPDEMYGETVGAAVVIRDGQHVTAEALKKWVREHLAAFKVPSQVFFPKSLPRTATGKLQRLSVARSLLDKQNGSAVNSITS